MCPSTSGFDMSPLRSSTEGWRKLTEDPTAVQKFDRSTRNVSRLHGKLTEADRRSPSCTENSQKVFWPLRKLTKVDGMSHGCMESWQKLTKGLLAEQTVDGSWLKVSRLQLKLTEVNGRSPDSTNIWQTLMECLRAAQKLDGGLPATQKSDGRSPRRTES